MPHFVDYCCWYETISAYPNALSQCPQFYLNQLPAPVCAGVKLLLVSIHLVTSEPAFT